MSELTEYQAELDEMLAKADFDAAMTFCNKWNLDWAVVPSDKESFMAGIHKTRIQRGIGVVESTKWLSMRGLKTMIEF